MQRPRMPAPPVPGGFGFPLGFLTAILATAATVAAGATAHPLWTLIALAATVVAIATVSTAAAATTTAVTSWALHTGFVLGRHGDLALTPQSTRDAAVLGTVALLAASGATLVRTLRRSAGTVPIPTQRRAAEPAGPLPVPHR